MVYGMVLLEFLLGQGLLWVYEVRTEWHTTDLPGPLQVLMWLESVMDCTTSGEQKAVSFQLNACFAW